MNWEWKDRAAEAGIKIARGAAGLIYPRRCPACDGVLAYGTGLICPECREKLVILREPLCRRCGKALRRQEAEYCYDCAHKLHSYEEGAALFDYRSARESIYRFKYKGRQEYAEFYAQETMKQLGGTIRRWDAQALIPVPLHRKKQKMRGYNQSALYARELSRLTGIPVMDRLVVRSRYTTPQKELDDAERQNNLKKAFKIEQNDVKLSTLIIIDDIYTTGSTVDAVARVCKDAGARQVYYIALAIGAGL